MFSNLANVTTKKHLCFKDSFEISVIMTKSIITCNIIIIHVRVLPPSIKIVLGTESSAAMILHFRRRGPHTPLSVDNLVLSKGHLPNCQLPKLFVMVKRWHNESVNADF